MVHKPTSTSQVSIPSSAKELIVRMVRPYRWRTVAFFALTTLGVMAWTASPLIIAIIVTDLGDDGTVDSSIWWWVGVFAFLRIIDEVFWRSAEWLMRSFKPQMIERVRNHLFSAALRRPHSFFVDSSSGRIGHWINQTVATMNDFVDTTIWNVWGRVVGLSVSAVFLLTAHWSLALLFVVWLVLLFSYNVRRGRRFGQLVALQSDETSKVAGTIVDAVGNHLSVRVNNAQAREHELIEHQQKQIIRRWRDSWGHHWITNAVKGQSANVASILALGLIIWLYSQGTVQLGDIVIFIAYFGDASGSLWQLAWALDSYYRHFGTIQNALDGLRGADERSINNEKPTPVPKKVAIELVDLAFAYQEQPDVPVLDALNLNIEAGQKVGLVGHSGAGKSTLIGLLLGLYEPTSGAIKFNGEDTLQHDPSYMRSLSAFVPQDASLFNRTIRENVAYGRPKISDKKLRQALKLAQAEKFVDAMPQKLDTVIGERGVKLSGGQRQRIAIARALAQDAPLVLLDEATSALDSVSEQAIQKALHDLMQNRTAVVIAHRLSTLKHLDVIVVMEGGKIVETGTHQALLRRKGIYADLWKRQKDGFIVD